MSFFPFLEAVILELNIPGRWKAYINHIHVDWQRYRQNPVFLVSSLLDPIPACPFILIWHVKSTLLTLCWKLRPCCVFGLYVKVGDYFCIFLDILSAVGETKICRAQVKSNVYAWSAAFKLPSSCFCAHIHLGFVPLVMLWCDLEDQHVFLEEEILTKTC